MDSLNNYDSLILLKLLNVKHKVFALARCCQKALEIPVASDVLSCQSLSDCAKRHCLDKRLDLSGLPCFVDL